MSDPVPPAVQTIARHHQLPEEFPAAVREEADRRAADLGLDDLPDLTRLPLCTIDEEHSRDLDQAVAIEAEGEGWVVWYAIADAAWFVRPGTPLFEEALARGATAYLPGLVVPMLPRVLSEAACSLNPGVDRRAMLFEAHLAPDGRLRDITLHRARVRSRVKTWFEAAQDFLDGRSDVPGGDPEVAASLRRLAEAGAARMALAEARDVVHLRRTEIAVSVGEGLRFVATADPRNDIERYNEQISLLCNSEGARLLRAGGTDDDRVDPIYRVHQPPGPERLAWFADTIDALVAAHGLDPATWAWRPEGDEPLARYLARLPHDRVAQAIHRQAILSGGRATFTAVPGRHHGVGADVYARFTAPMREIVGVFVHHEAWQRLGANPPSDDAGLREQVIDAAHRAQDRQRDLDHAVNRRVLDQILTADLDRSPRPRRRGTVMGLSPSKVHVRLDDPPIDVKVYRVHLEALRDTRLRVDDSETVLQGPDGSALCRVGDAVEVMVAGLDPEQDRWRLDLRAV